MRKILTILILVLSVQLLNAQTVLTIENQDSINTEAGTWYGWNITRSTPTTFTFTNNTITSHNTVGYMLQSGDESILATNNNLDNAIITGNKLSWVGDKTAATVTHGLFTGYNIDVTIKYNYLDVVPMGIVRKSNGMTDTQGAIAYNIFRSPEGTAIAIKGMNGIRVYNNTFYSSNIFYTGPGSGTWRGLIDVYENDSPVALSTGTKIKNNVFYTKNQIYNIYVYETSCLTGFESDYNVYYCEAGTPLFKIGSTVYTFAQWQALGYDTHSTVINPNFVDTVNFTPGIRLGYGIDLGVEFETGLAPESVWGSGNPATATQAGDWQVGAVILTGATYYLSPYGNDTSGDGSFLFPWFSLVKAWTAVGAGDIIYMRGGTYAFNVIQTLSSRSGTSGNLIKILPYQLEKPILTRAETITGGTWPMALVRLVSSDYVQIKGLEITGFIQDTVLASICSGLSLYLSDNCIIEQINSHHNGHGILIYQSGDNQILNCDTHHNYDPLDPFGDDGYGDGDGLEVSDYGVGTWTIIRGHRSWNNSDDGIDLWDSQRGVTIEDSWAWNNGYREDGVTTGGDGNGFKLGRLGSGIESYTTHLRTIQNNVSFNNRQTGFNQNDTRCIIHLYNNTSFGNPYGYHLFNMGTATLQVRNNISFNNTANGVFHSYDVLTNNTFLYTGATNTAYTVTNADFASVDSTGCSSPRQLWGEYPKTSFLRLALGSDLVNAGYNVGLSYYSTAPDIGAYERWGTTYYVKTGGNDGLAGTSDATAWATLSKVHGITFTYGDSILFRRGDTFRGSVYQAENGSADAYIVYGAYGTGAKPKILGSKDISLTTDWTVHSGNIWKTTATLGTLQSDISNIIFNNETSIGYKKNSLDSLNIQGEFFYNIADNLLYLYSASNPGTFYSHIEAAGHYDVNQGLLKWNASSYIIVRDLDIRYSSSAGVEFGESNHFIVEDCDVSWIGGEWFNHVTRIRLGNGISMINNVSYGIVRNNYVSECYDAGISPQGWTAGYVQSYIDQYKNTIVNCYYSYEGYGASTGQSMISVNFYNNTCVDAASCWSNNAYQRADYVNSRHVMIWKEDGIHTDCIIKNNIFTGTCLAAIRINQDDSYPIKHFFDNNLYNVTTMASTYGGIVTTLSQWQTNESQDLNSINANPLFVSSINFNLLSNSPAINEGINIGLPYYNIAPDIGAYEYQYIFIPSVSGFGRVGNRFGRIGNKFGIIR